MTNSHKNHRADYAVVGSGIAGLRAAIELSKAGSVLVLAKSNLSDSATAWAQGGIAVALSDEDEIGLHEQDTIKDRKSTRLNSSHVAISYAVFCLKKKKTQRDGGNHISS